VIVAARNQDGRKLSDLERGMRRNLHHTIDLGRIG
jgi:hypothetical protein